MKKRSKFIAVLVLLVLFVFIIYFSFFNTSTVSYNSGANISILDDVKDFEISKEEEEEIDKFKPIHLETPESVRSIYMTSWVAGTPSLRDNLLKIIDETEINSVVIDIKDDTGRISFEVFDEFLIEMGSQEIRILNLRELIKDLNEKGVYVIGRVSVFQDPYLTNKRPDLAVKRETDGAVWKDRKGLSWVDPGSKEVWDYNIAIGKEAYRAGFDEINYDYIRFPSDGNMRDIYYPFSEGKEKREVLRNFFSHLNKELKKDNIIISADVFGMVTTNKDDLNIGQYLEDFIPYFDFIAPMVYPSHYPNTWHGFANPAEYPYEVVNISMQTAVDRVKEYNDTVASTSIQKLRPWLQDFNLGATYTTKMVRDQIRATYDTGLNSWMMWNASNRYNTEALLRE